MSLAYDMREKRTTHAENISSDNPPKILEKQGNEKKDETQENLRPSHDDQHLSVAAFEKEVGLLFEELELDTAFQELELFLKELEKPVQHGKPSRETVEFYLKACEGLRVRFNKNEEESFFTWLKEQFVDEKSVFSRQGLLWEQHRRVSDGVKRFCKHLERFSLVMSKERINSTVSTRLENVLVLARGMQSMPPVADAEKIFENYLLVKAKRRAADPGVLAKLFGTSEQKEFGKVIDDLNMEWLMQRGSKSPMSNKDRLQAKTTSLFSSGAIKASVLASTDMSRINLDLKKQGQTLRQLIKESPGFSEHPEKTDIENLQEYRKTAGFSEAYVKTFNVLSPVLGRKTFVEKVICHAGLGQNEHSAGNFDLSDRVLRLYWRPGAEEYECIRTIAHETGHAMRLESSLSMKDAIRYAFEMVFCLEREGHVSQYSKDAAMIYAGKIERSMGEKFLTSQKNVEKAADMAIDASKQEEWAEMFAYSFVPSAMNSVAPIKSALVRKYAMKFGLDMDQARAKLQKRLPTVAFNPSDKSSVASAEAFVIGIPTTT